MSYRPADLRTDDDRRVDLHPLTFDTDGNGLQQLQDGSCGTYTADGLRGEGSIGTRPTTTIADVRLLAERFDLPLPPEYQSKRR